jgi:hypothetical protein
VATRGKHRAASAVGSRLHSLRTLEVSSGLEDTFAERGAGLKDSRMRSAADSAPRRAELHTDSGCCVTGWKKRPHDEARS